MFKVYKYSVSSSSNDLLPPHRLLHSFIYNYLNSIDTVVVTSLMVRSCLTANINTTTTIIDIKNIFSFLL